MKYSDNSLAILTIQTYKWIGKAWIVKNINLGNSIDKLLLLLNDSCKEEHIITLESFNEKKEYIKQKILKLKQSIDWITAIGDKDFPKYRWNVKNSDQPIVIFYKGNINLLSENNHNIAVIWLLKPEENAIIRENKIIKKLINNNVTVISWLALWCDKIAHEQTLKYRWKTVAILPSTINNISPSQNIDLAKEIISNNWLLISEYYEESKSQQELISRYQERDRLQALFSDYIILISSYAKNNIGNDSGSRLAMWYALNYWINRAVLYNEEIDFENPRFDLNRQLISEDKTILIIKHSNIIEQIVKNKSLKNKVEQNSLF